MLNIYCGREDIDKEAFLFSLVGQGIGTLREAGDADGRILLIVPDQFTLEAERGAFHYLGHEGFMELEIISLSRLRQRVFGEAGEDGRVPIGRNGRHMLLSAIIRQRIEELESFTGAQGVKALAEMMNDLISEMKLHNISPDDVRGLCEGEGQPVLKRKLADISMIYSSYEALTHGKYMDSEEHLMCFMAKLPKSRLVRDSIVWMYGFDYFSPKDIDIIKALASCARGLNIMLTSVPPAGGRAGSGAASSGGREAGAVALSAGGRREGEQAEAAAPSAGARRVGVQAGAGASSAGARAEAAPFYRDGDVFRITQRLIASLRASAGESGIRCEVHDICALGAELRARPPALSHIERELFSYPYSVYRGEAPELTLLSAANYYAEAESAAAEITRLIRDCGCRYRDIAVICNDLEKRGAVIKRVFSEYGLPVFMDKRKNLLHNPVLEYIAALMDIAAGNWRTEDVLRLMKTGMSPLDPAQCELLDEYAVRYRIRGKGGWTREFERLSPYEIPATQAEGGPGGRLERLNAARGAIVSHIMKFIDVISGLRSVEGRTRALYLFLRDEARLPEKLECQAGTFREAGHAERADELSQVWAQIVEIFDQMVAVLGDAKLSREDYSGLLAAGLENIEIGMIPTTNDQILIGTMQRTRTGRVDTLFVLGANDGVLPASGSGDGLLNDDERARIFRGGKMVGKLDALRAEEEQLAIYRNLSRVDRRLWMSYSASDPDGGELRPSLIFEKLRKMFPENGVRKDLRSSGEALELIGAKEGALVHLTAALREMADRAGPVAKAAAADAVAQAPQGQARQVAERPAPAGPEGAQAPPGRAGQAAEGVTPLGAPLADAVWLNALGWFRQNAPEKLKPIEAGILFTNRRERIGREYVKRLYGYGANAAAPGANTAEPRANAAEPGTGAAPDGVPHEGAGAVAASDAGMPEAAGTIAAPDGVPREGAGAVAASDAGMPEAAATVIRLSPSGLERYARCPFAHFVAYGLRPAESRTYEIGPRERGDLLHKVLMGFSKELTVPGVPVTGDGSKWMSVDREGCKMIVDGIFSRLMESPGDRDRAFAGIFKQGRLEEYRTERIKSAAYMAAWMIAEQVKAGIIDAMFFEERFGHGKNFPPVTRRMEDGTEIRIEGQIDRVDIISGGRVKIIDYKSGDESFDIEEARQGWRLQLMLYLEAATAPAAPAPTAAQAATAMAAALAGASATAVAPATATGAAFAAPAPAAPATERPRRPAGVFYFRIAEPRLDCGAWDMSGPGMGAERVEKELRKAFRMDGVAVDSQEALRAIAGTEFDGPHFNRGYSDIIAVRAGKDEATGEDVLLKSHPASRKLLDEEEFEQLRKDVGQRVHEFCAALADGVIYAEPKSAKEHSACRFCGYKAICCYDPRAAHGSPGIPGGTGIAGGPGNSPGGPGGQADSIDISIDIK